MRFSNLPRFICFLCTFMMMMMMSFGASSIAASAPRDCKLQDYDMETFIGANANHCTPTEMKKMEEMMDKVIYQIFPTVRGLEQADMTTCSSKQAQHPPPDDFGQRKLWWGTGSRKKAICRLCEYLDDNRDSWRRGLKQCRHQSWKTINGGSNNNDMMRLTTRRNTVHKTINLSSRTTYVKVDFTLLQQESNSIIEIKVNGRSPVQLEYIENETSRFRKNGILSASENYIRDSQGNLQHTKVTLHIDLSQQNYAFDDKEKLLLQFEMIPTTDDEGEENDKEAVIDHLIIKGANACAVKWSKTNQEEEESMSETTSIKTLEREMEWVLSDKLTAVLTVISDADANHCLNGKDPFVHVNLYKALGNGAKGHLVC